MSRQKAIRYQGRITTWKDDQGFGFIAPNGGGTLVFVHIKAFASRAIRPGVNDVVTYELTVNERGQPRADHVAFVSDRASVSASVHTPVSSMVAAACFLGVIGTFVLIGKLPSVIFGIYLGLSALTFIAYAVDKSAARNNRWRTKENTLLMLGLAGGWPGALVAQQVYRHKSKKQSFRSAFWFSVVVNCVALGWLLSSSGASVRF
jgi:uncharacterized membrane protein YsdA (DUF1294 family)/cold shock CspA family protein